MATPFLMYHELEASGRPLCQNDPGYTRYILSVLDFAAHIRHLAALNYQGVSVGEAVKFSSDRQVAISFDDGCETDLLAAAPILAAARFGATFYVTAGFVGRPGYLSATQLRELSSAFEIGCHSMTHAYLPDLDATGLEQEVLDAKARLEDVIGKSVEHFSCPGGRFDEHVIDAVQGAGYRTMSTSVLQLNSKSTDPYRLGRFAVMRNTTLPQLERACRGEGFLALNLLQGARNSAKRLLGNRLYDGLRARMLGSKAGQ